MSEGGSPTGDPALREPAPIGTVHDARTAPLDEPPPAGPGLDAAPFPEEEPEPDVRQSIEIRGLRKRYGDTIALAGLDLVARPGEILGVAGPNGAGKSTLIKILAGEVPHDEGSILIDGEPWSPTTTTRRVAVVHQEPQLFPNLTVAENVLVGRERSRILRHGLNERERALMADLAIAEYADKRLEQVTLAVQQRTEICRALAQDARVFLFDEPNSALTEEESDDLFRRMHGLAERGRVVILVSHRLAELVKHTARVAIILDGKRSAVIAGGELTQDAIARKLTVGHADREAEDTRAGGDGRGAREDRILTLSGWSHSRGEFQGVDLEVRAGEILGLVGVEGSGARELVRSIAGFERSSGDMVVGGAAEGNGQPDRATAFVPADRQNSLFTNLSVGNNLVSRLDREITGLAGTLLRGRMTAIAARMRDRFRVKTQNLTQPIRSLSGGNQQKIAIAAAVVTRPRVLVLEEPTRGVDVGSKREIYRLLREFAHEGAHGVVIYATEVPELFEVADRVFVVSDGRLSRPLLVSDYPDVESLAAAITELEEHGRSVPAVQPVASPA